MLHARMLHYLDEVARSGSIRKAAERLNVSATAINKQILLLEAECRVPLFERMPRGMRLTSAGEVLIGHVRRTLRDYRQAELQIEQLRGLSAGTVTLGTMSGVAGGVLPRLLGDFNERHPLVAITTRTMFAADIVRLLVEGDLDLALAYSLPADPRVQVVERFDGRLGAVMSPSHPLALQRALLPQDCLPFPLVLAEDSMVMFRTVADMFTRADTPLTPAHRTNSIEFMKAIVRRQEAIAFLSRYDIDEEEKEGTLVFVPMKGKISPNPLILAQHARRPPGLAATLLVDALRAGIHAIG